MIAIEKIRLDDSSAAELLAMSAQWEQENITYGYVANSMETLEKSDIFMARAEDSAVGYLLCHTYTQDEYTATVPQGKCRLEIDDLYILPQFRSQGIGRMLYQAAVDSYGDAIDFITLYTATKDYRAILHFYIEELGMSFWSASLFKEVEKNP